MGMGKNLRMIRLALELTQEQIADILGVAGPTYNTYENDKAEIKTAHINILRKKYNINPVFIYEGKGEMFLNHEKTDFLPPGANYNPSMFSDFIALFSNFMDKYSLSSDQQPNSQPNSIPIEAAAIISKLTSEQQKEALRYLKYLQQGEPKA